MNGAIAERICERLVHEPVLLEQRQPVEARARYANLEVVAAAGAVLDDELGRFGKRLPKQSLKPRGRHVAQA
jgi:hypothetical protein